MIGNWANGVEASGSSANGRLWQILLLAFVLANTGSAQLTKRVSKSSSGVPGNDDSSAGGGDRCVSADGRFVVFSSRATDLVPGDTNGAWDVFVHDRRTGATERVSVATGGAQADDGSSGASISADGRFIAFVSGADDLVAGDTNALGDIFVRDRRLGATERVSVATGGAQANGEGYDPSISADGRYVAFWSGATNLVANDTNGTYDVFVRDRQLGTTERVSIATGGAQGSGNSVSPSISADGRFVAFASLAANLVAGDTNGRGDVFVHDRQTGITERVSVVSGGRQGIGGDSGVDVYGIYGVSISADGRCVAFASTATNLVPGDANGGESDVYVHDRHSGTTERVSVDSNGVQGNASSSRPAISADGRCVAFGSFATNLVPGGMHDPGDIFLHDRRSGATERVTVARDGGAANSGSNDASISGDGRFVVFDSHANNLISSDTNQATDVFVRDRLETGFTSLCDPGIDGVRACPCANAPNGTGRGCDNSASTGGAVLAASGAGYLSIDSLVFTTSGERPTALSILMQGDVLLANGVVYGQGVRCAGGATKRLFVKNAVAGGILAPDLAAGDPSVSARSAAKGDLIQSGQSRWYVVYYRDPIVLGSCPASSTFNATQTGRVDWSL
jgi:Tol biopolymer transport system component